MRNRIGKGPKEQRRLVGSLGERPTLPLGCHVLGKAIQKRPSLSTDKAERRRLVGPGQLGVVRSLDPAAHMGAGKI